MRNTETTKEAEPETPPTTTSDADLNNSGDVTLSDLTRLVSLANE